MLMKIGLVLVAIVLVLTLFKRFSRQENKSEGERKAAEESAVEMKQDPVCGTFVDETTKYKVKYYDKIYYFCSDECKQKFIEQKRSENV